jgi:DNA-binding transcriptional regulator PaaX
MNFDSWLLLLLTLRANNATIRVRYWRTLKTRGCVALRDGVYLLPANTQTESALRELAHEIMEGGGVVHLLRAQHFDAEQEIELRSMFNRSEEFAEFVRSLPKFKETLFSKTPREISSLLRRLQKKLDDIIYIDFFPNEASTKAIATWKDFVLFAKTLFTHLNHSNDSG